MHKSGTTLISQILDKSGINMGNFDKTISYDKGNQYERIECQNINMTILSCLHKHSLDVLKPIHSIPDNARVAMEIKRLINNLNRDHTFWGFKDPRTCLTYAIWKEYLPKHKVVCVFRHPLEVYHHYQRNIPKYKINQRLKTGYKTLKAWYIYNEQIVQRIRQNQIDYILIDFNKLISSFNYITKLERFTQRSLVDCRTRDLYRAKQRYSFLYDFIKLLIKLFNGYDVNNIYRGLVYYEKDL